jgi:hypothetical protein
MPTSFLTVDEVLAIHAHLIERYGGSPGIRDLGLLRSALAMPEASFGGETLHATLYEQAAAYCFHSVKNHPFVDGNKRVGLAVASWRAAPYRDWATKIARSLDQQVSSVVSVPGLGGIARQRASGFPSSRSGSLRVRAQRPRLSIP